MHIYASRSECKQSVMVPAALLFRILLLSYCNPFALQKDFVFDMCVSTCCTHSVATSVVQESRKTMDWVDTLSSIHFAEVITVSNGADPWTCRPGRSLLGQSHALSCTTEGKKVR